MTADSTSPTGIDRTALQPGVPSYEPVPQGRNGDQAPIQPADDDLDLLAESNRRMGKVTIALMAAVLAGLAFIGGVAVQKQFGNSSGGAPGGGMSAMGGGQSRGGYGQSGALPGGGGGYGGGGFGGQSGSAGGSAGASGNQASTSPVVVGTVTKVSGRTLIVKNFSGTAVTVKVPQGTTVTDSSATALSGLVKGVSVSVVGTKAGDGVVTATSISAS
ncbi:hypothetical protein GCM10022223_21590 [Kineosporia mesophila]|uniref:DUF5666 domain-containing protein n=1 Tax=Kineosporia mesophila TaxID=566012 RepID=A0ABP6ZIA9_9ACTN|nr:hypothetical protein [Kineosporia mesophila]MCD5350249.1 hypothetical protein [Kineosporia mesophila]